MDRDLFLSILALDSYNHGYNAGIEVDGTQIGTALITKDADNAAAQAIGFYGIAYNWNGETIISYRGTDRPAPKTTRTAPAAEPQGENSVPPEIAAKIGELRTKIQLSIGQIVLSVMNLPRYKHQSLADLSHILIEPLLRDRVAIAHKQIKAADGTISIDEESVAGIAIWATVSDAVDAKITEQIRAGAFPVRLGVDDWTSGEHVWLLDVVAGDRKQATSVLANFRQLAGEKPVKIHPIIGRLIDPAVLEKLRNAEKTDALASRPAAGRA